MVFLDDDKRKLAEICAAVRERLAAERLLLHSRKAHIVPTRHGLSLPGYQVFPGFRRLRPDGSRLRRWPDRVVEG